MATSWDRHEFSPADIGLFAKWLGWASPPEHYHNDGSLAERETWFWVSGDALERSQAMLRPDTWRELETAAQLRQERLFHAASAAGGDVVEVDGAADVLSGPDRLLGSDRLEELMENPDPFIGLRWVSHRCRDGSPLWLTIPSPSVWQRARRCSVGDTDTPLAAACGRSPRRRCLPPRRVGRHARSPNSDDTRTVSAVCGCSHCAHRRTRSRRAYIGSG